MSARSSPLLSRRWLCTPPRTARWRSTRTRLSKVSLNLPSERPLSATYISRTRRPPRDWRRRGQRRGLKGTRGARRPPRRTRLAEGGNTTRLLAYRYKILDVNRRLLVTASDLLLHIARHREIAHRFRGPSLLGHVGLDRPPLSLLSLLCLSSLFNICCLPCVACGMAFTWLHAILVSRPPSSPNKR